MKIFVAESSPHKQGSSNLLAERFIKGALENGHEVTVFDAAHADMHPCLGCDHCAMQGPCIQNDDMERQKAKILEADMLVLVTPLYYFSVSAQLKMFIDRFYSFNGELTSRHLKTILIAASWNEDEWTMDPLESYYKTLVRYLDFDDQGMILASGCGTVSMTKRTSFPQKAYELGKSI